MKMEDDSMELESQFVSSKAVLCRATGGTGSNGRRKSHWDTNETIGYRSNTSLLTTMEKFVQTVDDMNETILVPCRLMDAKFEETEGFNVRNRRSVDPKIRLFTNLNGVDLFQFYTVINSVKNDLMWGSSQCLQSTPPQHGIVASPSSSGYTTAAPSVSNLSVVSASGGNMSSSASVVTSSSSNTSTNGIEGKIRRGHQRRPSTVSTTSSASASDTEFSDLNEDSGLEGEEEYSQHMADAFHHHLKGLQQCLKDLTLAANYVTNRYNNDLGGAN